MLAQLCNVFWKINKPIDKIYKDSFFHDCTQGKKSKVYESGLAGVVWLILLF